MKKLSLRPLYTLFSTLLALVAVVMLTGFVAADPPPTAPLQNAPRPIDLSTSDQVKIDSVASNDFIASNRFCLDGDCIDAWGEAVPATTTSFASGDSCGIYTAGVQASGMVPCLGHNPQVSCPAGFTRLGGDYQSPYDRWLFLCVKN